MTPTATEPLRLDVTGTAPTRFTRILGVELRKSIDTRSGRGLLVAIAILTALVMVIQLGVVLAEDVRVSYSDFLLSTTFSIGILLPVVGILLMTSEWSQRTAMVTFSLEPRRARVIVAKLVAGLMLAVAATLVALVLATICNALYGAWSDFGGDWDLTLALAGNYTLLQVVGMASGFALAALLLNSPAAIVIYFAYSFILPPLFEVGAQLIDWFGDLRPWIDFSAAQQPLINATMEGRDWAHLAVSGSIWLLLPLGLGLWRVLHTEVK
jgi:ABC-2 type transport system permease protein